MSTTIELQIQMPFTDDVEYSDDVYWTRWEMRQQIIANEDYDDKPDADWSAVWYEVNGNYFSDDEYDDDNESWYSLSS